jgi:glycosyltransferase involved in cell wall biosynthesis
MGYAVMEAMLSGTIPIASRVGAIPEIVEGTAAESYLFEPGNVDQLVRRMESVLTISPERLIGIGRRLREQALSKFNNEATKKAFFEALNN